MSFNSRIRKNQTATAATAVGAEVVGTVVGTAAANKILMDRIARGTSLAAKVSMVVKTSSCTLTPKWQGSHDGTNWEDLFTVNSAANVATAGGTGSAVTTARTLLLPVVPFLYARVVFVVGGATAHITDETYAVSYHYLEQSWNE